MTDSHPQTGFIELNPFPASGNPNLALTPFASAFLACVSLCAAQEGPASPWNGLHCPCAALIGVASAFLGSYCLCAAPTGLLAGLRSCYLCASLECSFSGLIVLLAQDQTIPLANTAPRCS